MNLELSVPSKTFLLGEYLALVGGPALLLNTLPRFKLIVTDKNNKSKLNIDEHSPAANFIKKNADIFAKLSLNFEDPYEGQGGFGASAAQFCLAFLLKNYCLNNKIDIETLLKEYQAFSWQGNGYPPSGADVISQLNGGITYFERNKNLTVKKFVWPFFDLSFCLIHTGKKITTHHHLEKLNDIETKSLEPIVKTALDSLMLHQSDLFCEALTTYGQKLRTKGLVSGNTLQLLKTLNESHFIRAAKGCGALGADVICVVLDKQSAPDLIQFATTHHLNIVTIDNHACDGFMIKNNEDHLAENEVILVDENDQQIGVAEKIAAHKQGLLHRAYSVFTFRKNGKSIEVLLQQRHKNKYHCGGLWSNTCCSHPHPGEDMLASAQQRLQSEMGLNSELYEIGSFRYLAKFNNGLTEHEVDHVFVGFYNNETIQPNPKEVDNYQWIDIVKLKNELTKNPNLYTPWLAQALQLIVESNVLNSAL